MSRRIVVDGQVFQTPAWHRGMGKYSLELLIALQDKLNNGPTDVDGIDLVLSSRIKSDTAMLKTLKSKLQDVQITFLDLLPNEIGNDMISVKNRAAVDIFVDSKLNSKNQEIDFLILSLMQGEIFPTFPSKRKGVINVVLMYDLIPLMFHDIYLRNMITRTEYLAKIGELLKVDLYLAISKTVANDVLLYLGVDEKRVISIDGGPINHGSKSIKYDIKKPFILMPTGNDLRKNNRRAIIGFNEFNGKNYGRYSLVITSSFKDHEIDELSRLAKNVIFTGNLSGEELNYLYDESSALLFPPEYEGLGLPILEAVQKNKRIACSNISVFNEMSDSGFCYFDPFSTSEIALALGEAVATSKVSKREYNSILEKYTWSETASKVLNGLIGCDENDVTEKQKLVVCGPNPYLRIDASRLIQENHTELSRFFDIRYYFDQMNESVESRVNYLSYITNSNVFKAGIVPNRTDNILYHIGNGKAFAYTLFTALALPGTVLLYDTDLSLTWSAMIDLGLIDETRLALEKAIDKDIALEGVHGLGSLLAEQRAVLVFDNKITNQIKKIINLIGSDARVKCVGLPIPGLAYPSALPIKNINELDASIIKNSDLSDSKYFDLLRRARFVDIPDTASALYVFDSMRFAGVPCITEIQSERHGLPSAGAILIDSKMTFEHAVKTHSKDYEALSQNALKYVHSEHSLSAYISTLRQTLVAQSQEV